MKCTHEKHFQRTKTKHIRKLQGLTKEKKDKNKDDPAMEKWVRNISKHPLTTAEYSVLSR